MKIIIYAIIAFSIFIFSNEKIYPVNLNLIIPDEICIVSGEKIEGEGVKYSYLGTEFKFCCESCEKSFKKNPAKYVKEGELKCPICDEFDAKKNISYVSGGVKYYFCSNGCKNKFQNNPSEELKKYEK